MTKKPPYRSLFLGAGVQMHCGVGQFTLRLAQTIEKLNPGTTATLVLTREDGTAAEMWRTVELAQNVVCNFPIVAWKQVILAPLLVLAIARLRGRRVILLQHEWRSLHWLRRLTYVPALLLANTIVVFSPLIRQQIAADPLVGWTARKCVLAPLPPNIEAPAGTSESSLYERLAAAHDAGRLIIGHFGSIYPGKQPQRLLEIGAVLAARGLRPLIVYVGSFIRGIDRVEEEFYARADELRIADAVIVSDYIASNNEVFGLFSLVDAFCYPLDEGLTARRSSILACVQSGKPVVVTGPADGNEFDHHPRFRALIEHDAITLVPRGAAEDAYADAIIAALERPPVQLPFDFDGWWSDVAHAVQAQYSVTGVGEIAPGNADRTPQAGT